ncbi:hypothetical protein LMI01_09940 [Companilactobacillus mindensis]|nr:hypothetical protein LMI01_09940 [Companilactobacillus mindensis]
MIDEDESNDKHSYAVPKIDCFIKLFIHRLISKYIILKMYTFYYTPYNKLKKCIYYSKNQLY